MQLLRRSGHSIVAAVRRTDAIAGVEVVQTPDIRTVNWTHNLQGVDTVIHLAARAHIVRERNSDPLAEFRAVNVHPTIKLFRACQAVGVERFIFVSSIGVNGTFTEGRAFSETDIPRPVEPYAISKWEAEESLRSLLVRHSTKLIVVRPSLIYGPSAKGNLLRLMRWIDAGWPLPFGAVSARRSFLGLTAFCGLLQKCAEVPCEGVQLFLAGDDLPLSTRELVSALAVAMKVKVRQPRIPVSWLSIMAHVINRGAEFDRLTTSLEVDSSRARSILGWTSPPSETDLHHMVNAYLRAKDDCR